MPSNQIGAGGEQSRGDGRCGRRNKLRRLKLGRLKLSRFTDCACDTVVVGPSMRNHDNS
jgi:hypothetical protein